MTAADFIFRMWDPIDKTMTHPFELFDIAVPNGISLLTNKRAFGEKEYGQIMRFAGITDEKGVKVFAGDIVNFQSRGMMFRAVVVDKVWTFDYEPAGEFSKQYANMIYPPGHNILVVGNIFETKELLNA